VPSGRGRLKHGASRSNGRTFLIVRSRDALHGILQLYSSELLLCKVKGPDSFLIILVTPAGPGCVGHCTHAGYCPADTRSTLFTFRLHFASRDLSQPEP
jgi:hypothetical protein